MASFIPVGRAPWPAAGALAGLFQRIINRTIPHNRPSAPGTNHMNAFNNESTLQYGLSVHEILIPGEDPAAFENLLDQFELDHKPATATEVVLVHDLVKFHWLKNRAIRLQQKAFVNPENIDTKFLDQMTRLQNVNHRHFITTLKTLQAAQKVRRSVDEENAPPVFTEIIFPKYPGLGRDGYPLRPGINDHYEDLPESEDDDPEEPPRVFTRPPGKLA
jgi:hypothetical protein